MVAHTHRSLRYHLGRGRKKSSAYFTGWHSRWPWLRHKAGAGLLLLMLLFGSGSLVGCSQVFDLDAEEWQAICTTALWCAVPELPAEQINVVFHSFVGSPATPETAPTVIRQVLERAVDRPGSLIRTWAAGTTTVMVSELTSPSWEGRSRRAQKAERRRWLTDTEATIKKAITPYLATPPSEPSSLAEALATVSLAAEGTALTRRQLVAVANGQEILLKRAGCELLLADTAVLAALPWRQVLTPGMLRETHVHIVGFGPPPLPGFPVSYSFRLALWESLWGDALWQAGAKEVFLEGGANGVHFTDAAFPFRDGNSFSLLPSVDQEQPAK